MNADRELHHKLLILVDVFKGQIVWVGRCSCGWFIAHDDAEQVAGCWQQNHIEREQLRVSVLASHCRREERWRAPSGETAE